MSNDLAQSVERLYTVFGKYGLHAPVSGCEHCVMREDIAHIQAKPLRKLDAVDLSKYAFKAMTTWGEEKDFKYFVPRLFELGADEILQGVGEFQLESLFGKLEYAQWKNWPADEQKAIQDYLFCLWRDTLDQASDASEYLGCLIQAKVPLAPFLHYWLNESGEVGISKLVDFGNEVLGSLTHHNTIKQPWWNDRPDQAREVSEWLLSEATVRRLEEHAVEHPEEQYSEAAFEIAGYLRALRTT